MDNLIREDTVFGKRVNLVGNISADLVLESLGKVYIKSRNKAQTLEELITSLVTTDPNTSTSRVKVVKGIENLEDLKDGTFVYDKLSNILYIYIDNELLELINVSPDSEGYVKRSGDTMTGRLTIHVKNGPPLYVNSTDLVENLNALYLNGETALHFTRRNKDEKIKGKWTFEAPTTFESNSLFYKDIVTHGSIGSPNFSSGFGGYGWRMDADTNTLTVDNLIVRKLMHVYELVVNKISATNGSLWITNAGKVVKVQKLEIKLPNFFSDTTEYERFCAELQKGEAFIKQVGTGTESLDSDSFATPDGTTYVSGTTYPSALVLRDSKFVLIKSEVSSNLYFTVDTSDNYFRCPLFDPNFRFDCVFPIISRSDYASYKSVDPSRIEYYQKLIEQLLAQLAAALSAQDTLAINGILSGIGQFLSQLNNLLQRYNFSNKIKYIRTYYKYFAKGDYYLVSFDSDLLPVFKPGDIVRCLKWTYGGIKYYDGVICNSFGNNFIIQLALSMLDKTTTIKYDESLNPEITVQLDEENSALYNSSVRTANGESPIGIIEKDDSIVLMGHLWDIQRLNAVYITSTDNGAPFMDVMSGINRPDFSVVYYTPIYKTIKLHKTSFNRNEITGYLYLEEIPYTGDYYVLKDNSLYEYICFKKNNKNYLTKNGLDPLPSNSEILYYLSTLPNSNTVIGDSVDNFNILLEDGGKLLGESNEEIILEKNIQLLTLASTRTTKARFGNLDGIQDELFSISKQPYGYGLYGQNVFLTGEFYLSNGQAVANIGKEAIEFAIASSKAGNDALYILELDLKRADKLLELKVYTKGDLLTAGMRIGEDRLLNPCIALWGNKIVIATTKNELLGVSLPTALFANGRISAKFLAVSNAHSILGLEQTNVVLVEYETNTTPVLKFYKEEVIQSEEVEVEEETVTKYYYELSYQKGTLPAGTKVYTDDLTVLGYLTYGWNLEAMGDGYLAFGKINWDTNGSFNINIGNNAKFKVLDSNNNEVFTISNISYDNSAGTAINIYDNTLNGGSTFGEENQNDEELDKIKTIDSSSHIINNSEIYIKVNSIGTIEFWENPPSTSLDPTPTWADPSGFASYNEKISIELKDSSNNTILSLQMIYDISLQKYRGQKRFMYNGNIGSILMVCGFHKVKSINLNIEIVSTKFSSQIGLDFFQISGGSILNVNNDEVLMFNIAGKSGITINGSGIILKKLDSLGDYINVNLLGKLDELETRIYSLEHPNND